MPGNENAEEQEPDSVESAKESDAGKPEVRDPAQLEALGMAASGIDYDDRESKIRPIRKAMGPEQAEPDIGARVEALAEDGEEVEPTEPDDTDPDSLTLEE